MISENQKIVHALENGGLQNAADIVHACRATSTRSSAT
jgi:hypothetical protein